MTRCSHQGLPYITCATRYDEKMSLSSRMTLTEKQDPPTQEGSPEHIEGLHDVVELEEIDGVWIR